jgi:hypothetical protein
MARFKNYLLVVIGFAFAGMIGAAFGSGTAQAVVSTLVSVVNTSANPVQVQHVVADNPATQAVVLYVTCAFSSGAVGSESLNDTNTHTTFTVPAGNRLVIEYTTGSGTVPRSQTPLFNLTPSFGLTNYTIYPTLVFTGSEPNGDAIYTFDAHARAYADPGGNVFALCGDAALVGSGSFGAFVVGHLEAIQ